MEKELETLFTTLMQIGKIIDQQSRKSIEERNATMLQFSVLSYIKDQPKATMGDLATNLQLSISSATQITERLVKVHFVKRFNDPIDRRITRLTLTTKGVEEHTRIKEEILKTMKHIFLRIPHHDRKELIRIHTELLASFSTNTSIQQGVIQ